MLYKRRRSAESYQIRSLRTVAAVVDAAHAGPRQPECPTKGYASLSDLLIRRVGMCCDVVLPNLQSALSSTMLL